MKKINEDKFDFKWNVWTWNFNQDELESYDVVPTLVGELNRLKNNEKPKTKEEFEKFLKREAQYHFWSKCEYEMIIHGWPMQKRDVKVDVYEQLQLNWNCFVDAFWNCLNVDVKNANHRKQRVRTAPNRTPKK